MIYLILKMFLYLLLALVAGGGAGWLLRHLAATRQDEEMQRTLADARARVPQFESLIRSRDEQISRLKEDLKEKDVRINGLVSEVREAENAAREKERELKAHVARNESLDLAESPAAGELLETSAGSDTGTAGVEAELDRLNRELAEARAQTADAISEAAAAEAEVVTLKAALARAGSAGDDAGRQEVTELEARLKQKAMEYERLAQELEQEQRRVVELERERELQNKSLRVLHQQLELERERGQRVVNG